MESYSGEVYIHAARDVRAKAILVRRGVKLTRLRCSATMVAPNRRTIYQASLESYIDELHNKLLAKKLFPVPLEDLKPWEGLNNKTARVRTFKTQAIMSAR